MELTLINYALLAGLFLIIVGISLLIIRLKRGKVNKNYWDNGKIRRKSYSKKTIGKFGKEIFYYRNGKVNKIQYWQNNKLDGISTIYYKSGEIYIKKNYKLGILDGEYIVLSKDNTILKSDFYKDGIIANSSISEDQKNNFQTKALNIIYTPLIDENKRKSFSDASYTYRLVKQEEETKDNIKNESGFLPGLKKVGKIVSGVQAYQNRKSGINLKEACELYYEAANTVTEDRRTNLNERINSFATHRLSALQKTTGRFLGLLKEMNQTNKIKEYEILDSIGLNTKTIEKMERVDMAASKALFSSATVGALGTAAAMGTPTLVTGAVGALASASTGTAISSLSGAAATNATLAWLGGGSIATGGGGMAAGATVLTGLTAGATAGVALIAAGLIASVHYSKKLTEAKEYQKEIEIMVANMEKLWALLDGINNRIAELSLVTSELEKRILSYLLYLEPLSVDYDATDEYYNRIFQKVGLLVKSMSELAQTPLLDEMGNASNESAMIFKQTSKILNNEIVNNGL